MFDKVAQYYRNGETGKGIKLLKKVLLKMAKNDRMNMDTKVQPKATASKKISKNPRKKT